MANQRVKLLVDERFTTYQCHNRNVKVRALVDDILVGLDGQRRLLVREITVRAEPALSIASESDKNLYKAKLLPAE
jgi:hypothetical protein